MTEGGDAVAVAQRLRAAGSVFAEEEAEAILSSAATPAQVERWVAQRCAGEPLEHVVGWVEFYQQRISIDPGVFVPRRRTELMVREAVSLASRGLSARGATGTLRERVTVVDLCCGSAAVGVATAGALADEGYLVDLRAADLDPIAVACAHRNVAPLGARAYRGDLFDALPTDLAGLLDVVTANTPYVPTREIDWMPPEARLHEPRTALDGGADGLDVARRVMAAAPRWLAPGGYVIVETSDRQSAALVAASNQSGLDAWVSQDAEIGATVVVATNAAP